MAVGKSAPKSGKGDQRLNNKAMSVHIQTHHGPASALASSSLILQLAPSPSPSMRFLKKFPFLWARCFYDLIVRLREILCVFISSKRAGYRRKRSSGEWSP